MPEPTKENERLASRLLTIGAALRNGGNGRANGRGGVATGLSDELITALAKGIVPFVRAQIAEAVAPLQQRLDALEKKKGLAPLAARNAELEKRIAELERRPGLTYQGVWDEQKVYNVGDFVTNGGSMWHCWDTNRGVRPGSSDAWQLAVQRGKPARDRR